MLVRTYMLVQLLKEKPSNLIEKDGAEEGKTVVLDGDTTKKDADLQLTFYPINDLFKKTNCVLNMI